MEEKTKRTLGDIIDLFNKCDTKEELEKFYLDYWKIVEETINKENNITIGDKRRFDLVFERVKSNIEYLLDKTTEMRRDYAYKIWWFLNI